MSFLSTLKPMELSMLRGIVRKTEFAYVEARKRRNEMEKSARSADLN